MSQTDRPKFARNRVLNEEKDRRRSEAKVRQGIYNALTTGEKLAKLGDRPAVKQRLKLALEAVTQDAAQKIAADVEKGIFPGETTVIVGKPKRKGKGKKNA